MRYALIDRPLAEWSKRWRVHFVDGDEGHVAYCGVMVSTEHRYSRRTRGEIRTLATCLNCLNVATARKKRR